jgi:hypothetical protein
MKTLLKNDSQMSSANNCCAVNATHGYCNRELFVNTDSSSVQCPQGSDNAVAAVCFCYVAAAGKHVRASTSEELSLNIMGRGNVLHVKWLYLLYFRTQD